MLKITGTRKEIIRFIDEHLTCTFAVDNEICKKYNNCNDCILENDKKYEFVIEEGE